MLGPDVGAFVDLAPLPDRPGDELVEAVGGALGVTLRRNGPDRLAGGKLGHRELLSSPTRRSAA